MVARLLLVALFSIGCATFANAQYRRPTPTNMPRQTAPPMQTKQLTGVVDRAGHGAIIVVDQENTNWQVAIPNTAKVQVTGTASVEALRPGTFVEFTADLDAKMHVGDKVAQVTIVSLNQEKQSGIFPPGEAGPGGAAGPGEAKGGGFGAEPGVLDDKPAKGSKPAKPAKRSGAFTAGSYRVVGRLGGGRGGKYTVQTPPHGSVLFEVADDAKVSVDFADYWLAAKGDKVTVSGVAVQGRPAMMAKELKIELADPLGGAGKKKPAAKAEGKHAASKKDKDKEGGLPEPAVEK